MLKEYGGNRICFKLFGKIMRELDEAKDMIAEISGGKISLATSENNLDILAVLNLEKNTDVDIVDGAVKSFVKTFSAFIYADEDISLEENAYRLLKVGRRTLCTAESFTGGSVAKAIVSIPGASDVFYSGFVCYNTEAKKEILGVSERTIHEKTVVSRDVAFEMVKGLLSSGRCDTGVATTGYASPTGDPSRPCGRCYIAAGKDDRIEVTRYKFYGSRTEIMEKGKNAALFLLNKVLRG